MIVALLGPVRSGKTSLLVTLSETAQYTHGFSDEVELAVADLIATPGAAPEAGQPAAFDRVQWKTLENATRESVYNEEFQPGSTLNAVLGYRVNLSCSHDDERATHDIALIDGGGGLMVPKFDQNFDNDPNYIPNRDSYLAILKQAVGVVMCVDIFEDNFDDWKDSFQVIQSLLADDTNGQRKFVAVAFTKTEQLFVLDGPRAVLLALNRWELRTRLRRALKNRAVRRLLQTLQSLRANAASEVDIRCFATSVYGYVVQNGCANCTHDGRQMLIRDAELSHMIHETHLGPGPGAAEGTNLAHDVATKALSIRRYWRPVLTIDPFVHAAGLMDDLPVRLAYEIDELLDIDDSDQPARPSQGQGGGL